MSPIGCVLLEAHVAVRHHAVGEAEAGGGVLDVQDHAPPAGQGVDAAHDLEQPAEVGRQAAVGDHEAALGA